MTVASFSAQRAVTTTSPAARQATVSVSVSLRSRGQQKDPAVSCATKRADPTKITDGLVCGECTVLVDQFEAAYGGRCSNYRGTMTQQHVDRFVGLVTQHPSQLRRNRLLCRQHRPRVLLPIPRPELPRLPRRGRDMRRETFTPNVLNRPLRVRISCMRPAPFG